MLTEPRVQVIIWRWTTAGAEVSLLNSLSCRHTSEYPETELHHFMVTMGVIQSPELELLIYHHATTSSMEYYSTAFIFLYISQSAALHVILQPPTTIFMYVFLSILCRAFCKSIKFLAVTSQSSHPDKTCPFKEVGNTEFVTGTVIFTCKQRHPSIQLTDFQIRVRQSWYKTSSPA